jgi:hypothetical protein
MALFLICFLISRRPSQKAGPGPKLRLLAGDCECEKFYS